MKKMLLTKQMSIAGKQIEISEHSMIQTNKRRENTD